MKRLVTLGLAFFLFAGLATAAAASAAKQKTFTGSISDSMCGLKHMMPGQSDAECTLECVKGGSKFILADPESKKVYELSDQEKPKAFAGQKVKVTGTLKGKEINVSSIEAAQ